MAGQDSNDRIAELLKQACPPAEASPEFKAGLRQQIVRQSAAPGAARPRPFWQQPLLWIPAAATAAVAVVLVVYFAAFRSTGLTIVTSDATGIETTTATLNGNLDNLPTTDDVQVSFEWGTDTSYGQETVPKIHSDGGTVQADLSGLEPETTYHYRLKVVNDEGVQYGPDRAFRTGPAPPAVTTGGASSVGAESAILAGSLDSLGSSQRVGVSFQWGTSQSYGHQTRVHGKTSTGEFTAEISGLQADTTYHFRAKGDGDGEPVYGADMTFKTGTAPPSVETGEAIAIGAGAARLTGKVNSLGTAESIAVSFFWGTAPGGPYTEAAGNPAMTREGNFSADLGGLEPGATYYFVACADGDGDPVFGAEKSFVGPTAPPSVATSAPTQVRADSATVHGVLDSMGTAAEVGVYFEWGLTPEYGSRTTPESRASTGAFNATLSGLLPGTTYHFRAVATGHGDASGADMMLTTGTAAPIQATWYLGQGPSENVNLMYEGDENQPQATLTLQSSGRPSSLVWISDQPAAGTVYGAGDWGIRLLIGQVDAEESVYVEIGASDNTGVFLPYGNRIFTGLGNDDVVYTYEDNITVDSFTVPSGGFVAVRVSTTSVHRAYVQVGGSRSFVQSPAYPEPTAPEVTTSAPADVAQTTATLKGYLDGVGSSGGAVTVYFEWGTSTAYGNRFDVGSREATGEFMAAIAALEPNTTYHFRAVAEGNGTAYGGDLVFTTPP